ncbi:negative regulator of systemic acquired resistance SNI1 isoform X1 [Tripterygium wilfordii]|uniref:negative regulator of systemic acquired resistance SNI1 isoform X1 n=1 Tax=Tripterygium wilfordii TaxID=458696 RepID=UPI0018F81576|nr:negative regulator of systemic acquired resistance SNI1 isoform X1 [Tripterygium wilfordii]
MATLGQRRATIVAMEENTLAILDSAEAKDTQDANDDRIAYLNAVRLASILADSPSPPTNKMAEAVFQILRVGKSLESIMESFRLLNELENCYPPAYVSNMDTSGSPILVVVEEAWSPFGFGSDVARSGKEPAAEIPLGPIDASGFHLLIQGLVEVADEANFQALDLKAIRRMLLFQYIVNALKGDFVPRNCVYKDTMNWNLLRESLLNMLLGSRRIIYKNLMKDCLSIMCGFQISNNFECSENPEAASGDDTALAIAVLEARKSTCIAMQKLLTIIMELDMSKNKAEMQGCTTRADGVRTPLVEIILDELTYDQDMLSQFLQVFTEPKWKLEIILRYFSKYTAKPSVHTRRSNGCTDDVTFNGVLRRLMDSTSSRNIIKKISTEVVQLLVAHAFQAHLSRSCQNFDGINDSDEVKATPLTEICKNLVSAFRSLRRMDEKMDILPFAKEALFTAATILSPKS